MNRAVLSILLEMLPMVGFFAASFFMSFMAATAVYVALTAVVVSIVWRLAKRLPYLSLIFGVFVIGSGLLSLTFREPDILIFADSLYFFLGMTVMLVSLTRQKTFTEWLFGYAFALTPRGWRILTWQWALVFFLAGISNEFVRLTMSPEWWIGFQFYRAFAINAFVGVQAITSMRHRIPELTNRWGIRKDIEF